jgi:outer membrane lipoprotein-sorting protein
MRINEPFFFASPGGGPGMNHGKKKGSLSRRARWAVPGTAVAVTAAAVAALQIPAAQASPSLPARTPAQLLASLSGDAKVPAMTGTVVETASLGLPQLPQTGNPSSLASLLTGSHTVKVYYQDENHFRLAIPQPSSETDVIADGSKLWLWQSSSDSVTEFVPTADKAKVKHSAPKLPQAPLTPQQAASQVLAAVGKTTLVSVQANVMVAGEPSYQLVLAPKDARSLVGKVVIAVDGKYGVPLRVQLYAKGASSPAFQVGYTALQWVAPAPANFSFTPPKGATVTVVNPAQEKAKPAGGKPDTSGFGTYGKSWLTVAALPEKDLMQGFGTSSGSTASQPDIASASNQGVGISSQELLNALFGSAKPVSGAWGSGTLVTTSLVSILMTGGEVYIGAVQPSVLYAAVGHTAS